MDPSITSIELDTAARPDDVAARLRAVTEQARLLRTPPRGPGARPMVGHVSARTFTVRLNTPYRNPFGALCHGELVETPSGTRVRARIRPSALPQLAVALWCVALGSIAIGRVWAARSGHAGAPVLALVAPAALMALGSIALAVLGLSLARGEGERLAVVVRAVLGERTAGSGAAPKRGGSKRGTSKGGGSKRDEQERDEPERGNQAEPAEDDPVEESSRESFPASDPPAWEPLHTGSPPRQRAR